MTKSEFIQILNTLGAGNVPFLFVADFELENPFIAALSDIDPDEIVFDLEGFTNSAQKQPSHINPEILDKKPLSFDDYKHKFEIVYNHLHYGDSYLANLTVKTEISLNSSLRQLFEVSNARYKLYFRNQFLVFSPECFIKIKDGMIYSFPMKGTIDASIPGAAEIILHDEKELAEHVTIVDLIRNDLSLVADHVEVKRFRYLDEIKTNQKNLLQVSSEITGRLPQNYREQLGEILVSLLPAGSVSGAPKRKTIEIIHEAEMERRGYYTGVFGYFDGRVLNSGVMIRFIENENNRLFYRSGGGITTQSNAVYEYQELIDKVYVPVD